MKNKNFKLKTSFTLQDKNFSEILSGSFITFGTRILIIILGFIFNYIIAKEYGSEGMGLFSVINSLMTILLIINMMGMNTSILRLIPEQIEKFSISSAFKLYRKMVVFIFGISIILSIIMFYYSNAIAQVFLKKEEIAILFSLAVYFILLQAWSVFNIETIRSLKSIRLYALISFMNALSKVIALILLSYFIYDKYNPVYTLFISYVVTTVTSTIAVYVLFKKRSMVKDLVNEMNIKEIVSISFPMFLTGVVYIVMSESDILMLSVMTDTKEVGVYSVALKLATLTSIILTSVNSIAAPKFSELYHSRAYEELRSVAKKSSKLMFLGSFPIVMILLFFGEYLLGYFGEEFIRGYAAMVLLAIGLFINSAVGSVGFFLNMTGHQKALNIIVIIGGIINVFLNYLLIPVYGITGAALASIVSLILWNFLASQYIKEKFGFYIGYIPILKWDRGLA